MKTFVALLRGINVGGKNKLPMADLRTLLAELGLEEVATYIQSGNVVFRSDSESDELAKDIGGAIEQRFGFRPELMVLDAADLAAAIDGNPYPEAEYEPKTLHLTFLAEAPASPDLASLEEVRKDDERFELAGTVFYLHAPDGIGRSKLAAKIEKALGVSGTARNWRTVKKLEEMVAAAGAGD